MFGVLKIRMKDIPVFHLDAYLTLHRKTLTHILPFGRCELQFANSFMTVFNTTVLAGISKRESYLLYLGRDFFRFFSFNFCFVMFRLFLLIFLDEPFTWTNACFSEKTCCSFSCFTPGALLVFGTRYSDPVSST